MADDDGARTEAQHHARRQLFTPSSLDRQPVTTRSRADRLRADYSRFYRAESAPLTGFLIMAFGASVEDAWDAAQTAFTSAWVKWATLSDNRMARKAWLRTTATRAYWRLSPDRTHRSHHDVPDHPDTGLMPDDVVALANSTTDARLVLDTLPPTQRLHLTWHLDGYTNAEIAAQTGKNEAAVRKNISRALTTLSLRLKAVSHDQ
ncbi:sigma-70 family RNA polymerase sigma factor [Amycolatopsis sp. FBCC-B4732]|uniref:RNA polymerase sigma factor n=1 Tax=Amycolatopsis sp. FBCC-B4732 TaxID=3079339 RepID=UPI001FF3BABB|nr:sigma-70 family RNA polymerase sigma factor [Amycolatopsis sp. FBCC-B4732]UOX85609.1 sigma-70 family RNA polymerase sigma factor [Amycolatopsis sp. FBCC-B4732]